MILLRLYKLLQCAEQRLTRLNTIHGRKKWQTNQYYSDTRLFRCKKSRCWTVDTTKKTSHANNRRVECCLKKGLCSFPFWVAEQSVAAPLFQSPVFWVTLSVNYGSKKKNGADIMISQFKLQQKIPRSILVHMFCMQKIPCSISNLSCLGYRGQMAVSEQCRSIRGLI